MAVRDFTDGKGIAWKVWPVLPDQLQPRTAAEDYLGDYGAGWLCFESATERRRLAAYPPNWDQLSDAELQALLDRAAPAGRRHVSHLPPEDAPGA